jgi:dUTP pyrophosphatase
LVIGLTVLSGKEASALVEEMIDSQEQIQMCGVELTVGQIERFVSAGSVAFDNRERKISQTEKMPFDEAGWTDLSPGAYLVTFNEIVSVPGDAAAIARPRSTLLRSGASLETALWDPGYRGRSQSLLVVHNPFGLRVKKNARLMQLVFLRLGHDAENLYSGRYQGENI